MAEPGVSDQSGEGRAPKEHGELRTFLIADVRGYTLFTQRRGDTAAAALAMRFADLTREIVRAHDGSVIEFRGDEALCAFTSTRQAIVAALALQERFVDETAADPENPLPVGIGLDAGEAVPVENGYRGAALNLAARLCGRAGAGEILATTGVVHLAGKVDGVRYIDRGKVRLKNVPEPVGLIKIMSEGRDPAERLRLHWQPPPPPPRPGSRSRLGLVAVALAIGLLAAFLPSLLRDEALGGSVAAGSIGVLDGSGHLTGQVRVGDAPGAVVWGAGAVWVSDAVGGTLARLDPVSRAVLQRIPLAGGLGGVAVSEGDVWVANTDARTVSRIDPGSGPGQERVVATIPVGNGPEGIAAGDGRLWVANSIDATVTEIDARSGAVVGTYPIGALPTGVAIGGGRVWISERGADAVAELDPGTGNVIREIAVGQGPEGIAWGSNAVWVANSDDGTVSRIDPTSASVTSTVEVGADPVSIAAGEGAIWVAQAGDGSITQLDASGSVVRSVPLTNAPEAVAIVDGSVWVAVQASLSSHRGGTLTVGADIGLGSLDPGSIIDTFALNQLGPILAITNDGLVALRRVGGIGGSTVVPDLAATLPVPSDEGTSYTFVLRDDVRFSNGDEVAPVDVRSTFERLLSQPGGIAEPIPPRRARHPGGRWLQSNGVRPLARDRDRRRRRGAHRDVPADPFRS